MSDADRAATLQLTSTKATHRQMRLHAADPGPYGRPTPAVISAGRDIVDMNITLPKMADHLRGPRHHRPQLCGSERAAHGYDQDHGFGHITMATAAMPPASRCRSEDPDTWSSRRGGQSTSATHRHPDDRQRREPRLGETGSSLSSPSGLPASLIGKRFQPSSTLCGSPAPTTARSRRAATRQGPRQP